MFVLRFSQQKIYNELRWNEEGCRMETGQIGKVKTGFFFLFCNFHVNSVALQYFVSCFSVAKITLMFNILCCEFVKKLLFIAQKLTLWNLQTLYVSICKFLHVIFMVEKLANYHIHAVE